MKDKLKSKIKDIKGIGFVYDNCHKIYICEDKEDFKIAKKYCYDKLYNMEDLYSVYENSCKLRFISNWKLTKQFVTQFEEEWGIE